MAWKYLWSNQIKAFFKHSHWSQHKHFMTEVDLFVVGDRNTALTSICEGDKWRTRDDIEKVWEAILEQNGICLSCPAKVASNSSTGIQNMCTLPKCKHRVNPSNTCWVQSLQRMPRPHTKLPLWWSWSQRYKNTKVTTFSSYWLYNGIEVAIQLLM